MRSSRLLQPSRAHSGGSLACARASGDQTQRSLGRVLRVGEARSAAAAAELGALALTVERPHRLAADRAGGSSAGLAHPSCSKRRQDDVLEHLATGAWTGERHGHSRLNTAWTLPRIATCSGYVGSSASFSGCSRTRPFSRKKRFTVASSSPTKATTISPLRASDWRRTTT